jgi:hypothetical protein
MKDFWTHPLNWVVTADGQPRHEPDLVAWANWMETADRTVACDTLDDGVRVSTVFLGTDHNWTSHGPPILWETMIFGGPHDEAMWRYASLDEAVAGHAYALAVASGLREP